MIDEEKIEDQSSTKSRVLYVTHHRAIDSAMETPEEHQAPPSVPRVTSSSPVAAAAVAVEEEVGIPRLENVLEAGKEPEMEVLQLVGSADVAVGDGGGQEKAAVAEEKSVAKRKRGRPRGQAKTEAKAVTKVEDEEDVCFICFDGGDLVLCDRKGCPKAYHPTCIKRDEAFFRSKAKWNCGWHICSNCEKTSHYMCYTCTYSLCKGCIKHADILCARGNKGFCTACMRTIMLIENNGQGNKDMIQVDFDDKTSWEYLFKVYWVYLKTKLSLTFDELTKAKHPGQEAVLLAHKTKSESSDDLYDGNEGKGYSSDSFSGYQEGKTRSRKKRKKQPKLPVKENSPSMTITYNEKVLPLHSRLEWASKELLDLVAHMKNGDTSILSEFDVQALLLEYIKINNLRDPHRKSQIICDSRLRNLFGKTRVGHFEMLKLLELHFQKNEETQTDGIMPGGYMGHIATPFEIDNAIDNQMLTHKDKRRKRRKICVNRRQQTNLDEYAAINFHNINLIYLRRSLIESLIEDTEKFEGQVVGSVVRIRISSSDQKQDYRLVRVGGTSKVTTPYKVGEKTVDIMLEILNLNKKEVISIDEISNQEFSKDECTRLRQSIKFGLVRRFTVGEILEKAVALQAVRVNYWLEEEKLRLTHLRDRASENGHRKELRECVEKLELLNTPEERQRRQREIPEVHADPRMDPRYDSDDGEESDYYKQDDKVGPINISGRERKSSFQQRSGEIPKDKNISASKNSATSYQGKDERITRTGEGAPGVSSGNTILPLSTDSVDNSEIEKMWHYRDPMGTIQGPFSMFQLRKWNTSGYFPSDLTVWSINGKQDDSVLLTDAMKGFDSKENQFTMNASYDATAHSNANTELMKSLFSLPSPTISGKSSDPEKLQGTWSDQNHGHESQDTAAIQGNKECSNNHGKSGQSSKQVDCSLNASNNNPSNFVFLETKSIETPEQTQVVYFPDLPSPTPKPSNENKQSICSTASIPEGSDTQFPKIGGEWGGHSPTPEKLITVEELCADLAYSPILNDGQLSNSSPSHPASFISDWQALLDGSNEESVSDLLGEVEAMESRHGPPSPTSKDDCFSSVEGLSPTPEYGKPFSLNTEILMSSFSCHSAASNRPNVALEEKRFLDGHYSVTDETEGGTKFKATQWEGISETYHPPESSSASWDMSDSNINNNTDIGWGPMNRNANVDINWGGPVQININMGWGNGQGNHHPPQANANINWGNSPGNNNMGGVWPNHSGQRGSGYGRDRPSWNRQSSFGSGDGSGGSFRPSPKGQRICKFYESGHCKKGAFCNYLHP